MPKKFNHNSIFPNNPLLMCIIGSSGCGKTYLTFKMLTTPNFLDYENLYIYTTTPQQNEYQFLQGLNLLSKEDIQDLYTLYEDDDEMQNYPINDLLQEKIKIDNPNEKPTGIKVHITKNVEVLNVDKMNPNEKNLIIFDDCVTQKNQQVQKDFFTKGRHANCHCIYQSQSFYGMESQFIRKNSNCFILFDLNDKDLTQIMQSINHGMDKTQFKTLCKHTWDDPNDYNHVFINIRKPKSQRVKTNILELTDS